LFAQPGVVNQKKKEQQIGQFIEKKNIKNIIRFNLEE
jgi:hypothetical protein